MTDKPYYQHHVFFCLNQRDDSRPCCADRGAQRAQEHAKRRIKQLGLSGEGKVPVLVVYPEGTWYTYIDTQDIDEIIDVHLVGGKIVERLKI
jgi:hypothetical protein